MLHIGIALCMSSCRASLWKWNSCVPRDDTADAKSGAELSIPKVLFSKQCLHFTVFDAVRPRFSDVLPVSTVSPLFVTGVPVAGRGKAVRLPER